MGVARAVLLTALLGAGLAVGSAGPAAAARAPKCQPVFVHPGPWRPTEDIATWNAIEKWQWAVEDRYGRNYADWRRAKGANIDCGVLLGFVCTASGQPCR